MPNQSYSLGELAEFLQAELQGDPAITITGINTLASAQNGEVAFLDNARYRKQLVNTKASAVILAKSELAECPTNALIVTNPYISYAKVASKFAPVAAIQPGIHTTAIIDSNCQIHATACIGPNVVIKSGTTIAEHVIVDAGCVIGENAYIGAYSHLYPNVTAYHATQIGKHVIIHSGAVIGSDGFGLANDNGKWIKIPQLGKVIIGDHVEIGANTTIDRGALGDTVIEEGVKLDNQIQIAHNVRIGAHTAIAACTGIAGSTTIGKYCLIGGAVAIAGHLEITDRVMIAAMSGVAKSITMPGSYSSGIPAEKSRDWWKRLAHLRQLDKIIARLEKLEETVGKNIE